MFLVVGRRIIVFGVLFTAGLPALVLTLLGIAQLGDPFSAAKFLRSALWVSLPTGFTLARIAAVAELAIGTTLCAFLGRSRFPACAGACLVLLFLGLLLCVARRTPNAFSCGCFGSLIAPALARSLWIQVGIDVFLLAMLALHILLIGRAGATRGVAISDGEAE
jgi:hypothetical protein